SLIIPGESPKPLLFKEGVEYPSTAKYVTADNWIVKCTSSVGSSLQNGYIVTSPNGMTYRMDIIGLENGNNGNWQSIYPIGSTSFIPGDKYASGFAAAVTAYTSKITDKHGNSIDYEYTILNSAN